MKIEVVDLTEENLQDAPEWGTHPFSCKYCIYWELPEQCVDPLTEKKEEMMERKLNWVRDTRRSFGSCGRLIYVNKRPVGYAQYAPARFLPRSTHYQSGPPGEEAVLISCLFIPKKRLRKSGLGTRLLRSIIDDLTGRNVRAVESFARRSNPDNPSGPVDFYLRNGFEILRDDPEFPLVRLEL